MTTPERIELIEMDYVHGGWNYRVMRFDAPPRPETVPDDPDEWFEVREVHYDSAGKPVAYAAEEHGAGGGTLEELRSEHFMIAKAFDKPVLTVADFQPETKR